MKISLDDMAKVTAPWSDEIVERLNDNQKNYRTHEYSCGTNHFHPPLVATTAGWICESCDYTQDWAHEIIALGKTKIDITIPWDDMKKRQIIEQIKALFGITNPTYDEWRELMIDSTCAGVIGDLIVGAARASESNVVVSVASEMFLTTAAVCRGLESNTLLTGVAIKNSTSNIGHLSERSEAVAVAMDQETLEKLVHMMSCQNVVPKVAICVVAAQETWQVNSVTMQSMFVESTLLDEKSH